MRRKSLMVVGLVVLLISGTLGVIYLLLCHKPHFYRAKTFEPGELRTRQSRAFAQVVFSGLINDIINDRPSWQAAITEAQVNCFLNEDFITQGWAEKMLPALVNDLRVSFDKDVIQLGFRYGSDTWSTVISIKFRVWLVPKESNVVGMELLSLRAGAIPISAKLLMRQIAEFVERQNAERTTIEVSWYRDGRNPVALFRFLGRQPQSTAQLRTLKVSPGLLLIDGESINMVPQTSKAAPAGVNSQVESTGTPGSAATKPNDGSKALPVSTTGSGGEQ